jgi:hypothetical protein
LSKGEALAMIDNIMGVSKSSSWKVAQLIEDIWSIVSLVKLLFSSFAGLKKILI